MCCVEKLFVSEAAKGTLPAIGFQDSFSESALMDASLDDSGRVKSAPLHHVISDQTSTVFDRYLGCQDRRVIYGNMKRQSCGVVTDYKHGPYGQVPPLHESVKVDERDPESLGVAEAPIVWMVDILATVAIVQVPAGELVLVGPSWRCCEDRKRNL